MTRKGYAKKTVAERADPSSICSRQVTPGDRRAEEAQELVIFSNPRKSDRILRFSSPSSDKFGTNKQEKKSKKRAQTGMICGVIKFMGHGPWLPA